MAQRRRAPDPATGTLPCEYHQARHPSREFRSWSDYRGGTASVLKFARDCRDAEQEQGHRAKHDNPALHTIRSRAKTRARLSRCSLEYVWDDPGGLGYVHLVPYFAAILAGGAVCLNCHHPFDDAPGTQLEHRVPPRGEQDWPRLHTRNLWFACKRCNGIKRDQDYAAWLDREWEHQTAAVNARRVELADDRFSATYDVTMLF